MGLLLFVRYKWRSDPAQEEVLSVGFSGMFLVL